MDGRFKLKNFIENFQKISNFNIWIMSLDNENLSKINLKKLNEITNNLNKCNKNIKLVFELLKK